MAGSTPRVSVIVPVRDRRDLLRKTLDALAAQTVEEHEVLVVDDGSTDGSGDEATADAGAGRPVRLLRAGGRGAVAARSLAAAEARAPVLAFTDSDCEPEPGWLAAGLAGIDGGADLVAGRTIPARSVRLLERSVQVGRDDGLYATCNVFYRRDAFERAGGFDAGAGGRLGFRPGRALRDLGFGEDTLLGWRVRRTGRATFAPEAVVLHHVFAFEPASAIRRSWNTGGFPGLVREVPELRDELLRHRVVLGSDARVPLYLAVALLLGRRRRAAVATSLAWVGAEVAQSLRVDPSVRRAARLLPAVLALDAVTAAALLAGSARARTLVL